MTEKEMTRMGFAVAVFIVLVVLPELHTFPLPSAVPPVNSVLWMAFRVFNRYTASSLWASCMPK